MSDSSHKKVIIAALTYKREAGLRFLLNAIEGLFIPNNIDVDVLIVDNSPEHGARKQLVEFQKHSVNTIHVIHEPARGISNARNRVLDFAINSSADTLLMIDDDEQPMQNWLVEMLDALNKFNTGIAVGAVEPLFETSPSQWMDTGHYFRFGGFENGELLCEGNTSNVAIELDVLRKHNIKFDRRFDLSGGEDTYFFDQLSCAGERIVFAKNAVVYEIIVSQRATLNWLFKRWMRTGNTNALIKLLNGDNRIKILSEGIMRLCIGSAAILLSLIPAAFGFRTYLFANLRIAARGIGYLSAAMDLQYQEYKVVTR